LYKRRDGSYGLIVPEIADLHRIVVCML
jgi:hypothetical protein